MKKYCETCSKEFYTIPARVRVGKGRFCSARCSGIAIRKPTTTVNCHSCGSKLVRRIDYVERSKTGTCFCGPRCRSNWLEKVMPSGEKHHAWKGGESNYRARAIKAYGAVCSNSLCKIRAAGIEVQEKMLDVDHIEGRSSHLLENLRVLCVWCHAEKTRRTSIPDGAAG